MVFPVFENNLVLFASQLGIKLSYSNVKIHLSAVKFYAHLHGFNNDFKNFTRLYMVVRGIKKSQGNKFMKPKRNPVTPRMLEIIKFHLFNSSHRYEDKLMIWSAMLVAFFGFLRASEYTSKCVKSYEEDSTLSFTDVSISGDLISINVKSSKTDPFRMGVIIKIAANNSILCPVIALKQFMACHPSRTGPLFTFHNGRFLTRKDISKILVDFSQSSDNLSSHSFRIGAATTAASMGHPRWLIQSLGRWSSDCFRNYLRIPEKTISAVSLSMIQQPSNMDVYDPDLM